MSSTLKLQESNNKVYTPGDGHQQDEVTKFF